MTTNELLHISWLLRQSLRDELTDNEKAELSAWCSENPANQRLFDRCHNEDELIASLTDSTPFDEKAIWGNISARVPFQRRPQPVLYRMRSFRRIAAVAAVLILLTGAGWWLVRWHNAPPKLPVVSNAVSKMDIAPGHDRASLTLGNGSTLVLDSTFDGQLAQQGNTRIVNQHGQIAYAADGQDGPVLFNTMATPRGGQYKLILPDGTRVWLNAASSIRYPTAFTGKQREVEMTGEAYFEVSNNKSQPFIVTTGNMKVRVLGTSFNIMAYPEETTTTTLLSGAVQLSQTGQTVLLQPGQQAFADSKHLHIRKVDTSEAIAWKKGLFEFHSADIETVMRAIGRWYDADIQYQGVARNQQKLTAVVSMNSPAAEVLQILSESGYHFRVENKTIIVLP